MRVVEYNRDKTVAYAKKWAFGRNPKYYNYDNVGGDCTNFISQCLYNGSKVMNYEKTTGWYYINGNNKSPSWTGVEFLYKFIVNNKGVSIFGKEVKEDEIEIGDVIQLSFDGSSFGHSLILVNKNEMTVAAHTFNTYNRKLSTYIYEKARFIHIVGVRK
ncbi:MAG: amidase domain-containing protein [Clostridia bacterium]|nr:amidase domain-containing protein [Clostridia bacterium]